MTAGIVAGSWLSQILMLVGVVLLGALVRRSDVADVSPDQPVTPA